jgi:DNA-binding ferritin-like protein
MATRFAAYDSAGKAERVALVELLQEHLTTTVQLHQYVHSLELRVRNVSFVDVRESFHRIALATEQCTAFLDERIRDMGGAMQLQRTIADALRASHEDCWGALSFAACIDQITLRTHALMGFSVQAKSLMDRAVIHGDYNSLHVMTDCVYQISQLVALIQISVPVESGTIQRASAL